MLLCFGAAWPFSIWKSYNSKSNSGKSIWFLLVIFIGYLAGAAHKFLYNFDAVFYLYVLNGIMVAIDMALYVRNTGQAKKTARTKT
jgi:membrane protein DedA with SNARE-associated domain